MSTESQISANQANSQHSTGPRTQAGKEKVSRNATRHGLSSQYLPLSEAERPLFEAMEADLRRQVVPSGALQESIFIELAAAAWKRSVVLRLLSQATNCTESLFTDDDKVRKLLRHKADQDRAFNRSLRQLKEIQNSDLQRKAALHAHAIKNPGADLSGYPGLASYHKFTKQTQPFPETFENLTPEALQNTQKQAEQNRQAFRQYVEDFYANLYTPKAA
ncbi:MAG: hypothetical protein U0R19_28685 [Bryobacteraceae bacterium]